MNPRMISVIMPTFQRPHFLREALEHLASMDLDLPWEMIVVDDGSRDSTPEVVESYESRFPSLRYVQQENQGAGAARNHGASVATGDVLLFTDDDIIVTPDHLRRHLAAQRKFGNCAINGHWEYSDRSRREMESSQFGRFRLEVERWYRESAATYEPLGDNRFTPSGLVSWNMSIGAEAFAAIGAFDARIPHAGLEDQELSVRAQKWGLTFVYDRNIELRLNEPFATFEAFNERRRTGAYDTVRAALASPAVFAGKPMIMENLPPEHGDLSLAAQKKRIKQELATPRGRAALRAFVRVCESLRLGPRLLHRIYWSAAGVYVYLGVQEGLRDSPELDLARIGRP